MTRQTVMIERDTLRVSFDAQSGTFDVIVNGFSLTSLRAGFEHADGTVTGNDLEWTITESGDDALKVRGCAAGIAMDLNFAIRADLPHASGSAVEISASVSGDKPFTLERIVLVRGADFEAPEWLFVSGQKGASTGTFPGREDLEFSSQPVACWTTAGKSLFFSLPVRQSLPCDIRGRLAGGRVEEFEIDCSVGLDEQTAVSASPLTIAVTESPHDYLENYADAQSSNEARPIGPSPIAWNSWDYILDLVSEEYILQHLDFIDNDPVLREKIEYIIIDCGWQHVFGEWEANYRFPHGMEWLARQITDRGYKVGLWFCPIVFENCSVMAYWNDHLAAQGKSGYACRAWSCMQRIGLVLDIKNPEARQWLGDLFVRYRNMGFDYFKLDFLKHITNAYYFMGKRVPKGDLVREVVETIRDAVGDDCHIMGCNYPAESGGGVIDSCRVSGDVRPRWTFIKRNARSTASKYWMHNRFWVNDPDFAICRGHETSDDPDLERMHNMNVFFQPTDEDIQLPVMSMTPAEARTLLSVVILSGGSVTLSDNLLKLNELGLEMAKKTVAAEVGQAGRPVDLFTAGDPSLWVQQLDSGGARVGLINWTDEPLRQTVDVRKLTGKDADTGEEFWTGRKIELVDGKAEFDLPPHETQILVV